jgi:putative sterol carrier protein
MTLDELYEKMVEKSGSTILSEPVTASIFLNIAGDNPKNWLIKFIDGKISVENSPPSETPDATISLQGDVLLKVALKELNPVMAFMTGKLKVDGDVNLLGYLKTLLPSDE